MLAIHIFSHFLTRTCKQIILRPQPKIAAGLFDILMALASPASLLSEDSAFYSLGGEHVIPVGDVNRGQLIQVYQKAINVYTPADNQSEVFGTLEENLCYPRIGKLKDRLNNTWYVVNVGDRLRYISKLYCEIDNGIPVLTYHHLHKNEENKRFPHTSTTTSDVAFICKSGVLTCCNFLAFRSSSRSRTCSTCSRTPISCTALTATRPAEPLVGTILSSILRAHAARCRKNNLYVLYLSYPFGGYNQRAIQAAKDAGVHMAVTTVQGKVKPGDNPYTLKQLDVLRTDSAPLTEMMREPRSAAMA